MPALPRCVTWCNVTRAPTKPCRPKTGCENLVWPRRQQADAGNRTAEGQDFGERKFLHLLNLVPTLRSRAGDTCQTQRLSSQFKFRSFWGTKRSNISHRRLAEEAAVFAIKLRGTLVADFKSGTRRIDTSVQHQAACGLKPELFLILKRTH